MFQMIEIKYIPEQKKKEKNYWGQMIPGGLVIPMSYEKTKEKEEEKSSIIFKRLEIIYEFQLGNLVINSQTV